jgi:C2H2-type zinc finger
MAEICGVCEGEFATPAELVEHSRTAHGPGASVGPEAADTPEGTRSYTCGLCGATFASPARLANHVLIPHSPAGSQAEPAHG